MPFISDLQEKIKQLEAPDTEKDKNNLKEKKDRYERLRDLLLTYFGENDIDYSQLTLKSILELNERFLKHAEDAEKVQPIDKKNQPIHLIGIINEFLKEKKEEKLEPEKQQIEDLIKAYDQYEHKEAVKIQKVFRGYDTRKKEKEKEEKEESSAILIQKTFRGYSARKEFSRTKTPRGPSPKPVSGSDFDEILKIVRDLQAKIGQDLTDGAKTIFGRLSEIESSLLGLSKGFDVSAIMDSLAGINKELGITGAGSANNSTTIKDQLDSITKQLAELQKSSNTNSKNFLSVDSEDFKKMIARGFVSDSLVPQIIGGKNQFEINEYGLPIAVYKGENEISRFSNHVNEAIEAWQENSNHNDQTTYTSYSGHQKKVLATFSRLENRSVPGGENPIYCMTTVDKTGVGKTFISENAFLSEVAEPLKNFKDAFKKVFLNNLSNNSEILASSNIVDEISSDASLNVADKQTFKNIYNDYEKQSLARAEEKVDSGFTDKYKNIIDKIDDSDPAKEAEKKRLQDLLDKKQFKKLRASLVDERGAFRAELIPATSTSSTAPTDNLEDLWNNLELSRTTAIGLIKTHEKINYPTVLDVLLERKKELEEDYKTKYEAAEIAAASAAASSGTSAPAPTTISPNQEALKQKINRINQSITGISAYENEVYEGKQTKEFDQILLSQVVKENGLEEKITERVASKVSAEFSSKFVERKIEVANIKNADAISLTENEKEAISKNFADKLFGKVSKVGLKEAMNLEFAPTPFNGASVKSKSRNQVAIMFNGDFSGKTGGFPNNLCYIHVPGSDQAYLRAMVCTEKNMTVKDGKCFFKVYKNGKEVEEEHKVGDVVIDHDTIFHLTEKKDHNGNKIIDAAGKAKLEYKPINLNSSAISFDKDNLGKRAAQGANLIRDVANVATLGIFGSISTKLDSSSEGEREFGEKDFRRIQSAVKDMRILIGSTNQDGQRNFATMSSGVAISHSFGKETLQSKILGRKSSKADDRIAFTQEGEQIKFTFDKDGNLSGGNPDSFIEEPLLSSASKNKSFQGNSIYFQNRNLDISDLGVDFALFGKVSVISKDVIEAKATSASLDKGYNLSSRSGDVLVSDNIFYQDKTGKNQGIFKKINDKILVSGEFLEFLKENNPSINEDEVLKKLGQIRASFVDSVNVSVSVDFEKLELDKTVLYDSSSKTFLTSDKKYQSQDLQTITKEAKPGKVISATSQLKNNLMQIEGNAGKLDDLEEIYQAVAATKVVEEFRDKRWSTSLGVTESKNAEQKLREEQGLPSASCKPKNCQKLGDKQNQRTQ